ncbi:MAG: endo-1,4-beta-xylanase, partial [Anaerolineae bacterium]
MSNNLAETIRDTRFHRFEIKLEGELAQPGQDIVARQVRHKFLFGSNAFWLAHPLPSDWRAPLEEAFLGLFNAGTLPFYWGRYEPEEGRPREEAVMDAARWCTEHGITTKGHPLCWHTVCADWLLKYDNDTILEKQMARITREVSAFRGFIDMWDVINEVVIMPVFDKYDNAVSRIANHIGAVELTLRVFEQAREANPEATLLINDFDLSPAYEALLEELLARDCPIDAIGLQTHQHQGYRGADYMSDVIDRFGRFGKPLHFTENTLVSGELMPGDIVDLNDYQVSEWPSTPEGEARQRDQVEEMYSTIYARPEVEAIVWWDFIDGGWLNAPSGLLRRDLTPKPAYTRLKELIHGDWWFQEQTIPVGPDSAVVLTGPEGDYEIV